MRTVNKTKKSNIKCEHCEYWNMLSEICSVHHVKKITGTDAKFLIGIADIIIRRESEKHERRNT